jgi:micrococcal nuclease
MRDSAVILMLVTTLVLLRLECNAATVTGAVTRVIDGDTIEVEASHRVEAPFTIRLANIDAPEKGQPFGQESAKYLSALIMGKAVRIDYSKRDFFGRIIGTVYILAGDSDSLREVNRMLIAGGYAWVYRKYSRSQVLAGDEAQARAHRKGLWRETKPIPPWEHRRAIRNKGG